MCQSEVTKFELWRKGRRLTQAQLAEALSTHDDIVPQQWVSDVEARRYLPSRTRLMRLCNLYDVDPGDLGFCVVTTDRVAEVDQL